MSTPIPTRDQLLASLRKDFGDQSMFILGQNEKLMNIEMRSSGSLQLDVALGGGFPKGRLILLRGAEKAGKTTIASIAIAEAQKVEPEKENALIDLENSFNPNWARTLGVDVDNLFVSQPDTYAEKIYEMILAMLRTRQFAYIILDSTDGLMLKDEMASDDLEKESRVGGTSKLNSRAMRKLVNSGELKNSGTTLIFIQQLRDKIGGFSMYGTPTDSSGGRAFKHNSSQTLDVSVGEFFAKGSGETKEVLGQQSKIKISKNKVAPPFRTASIDLYYEGGVDRFKELVNVAKEIGVLQGTSWITFIDPRTGEKQVDAEGQDIKYNGKDKARDALIENVETGDGAIYTRILDMVNGVLRS